MSSPKSSILPSVKITAAAQAVSRIDSSNRRAVVTLQRSLAAVASAFTASQTSRADIATASSGRLSAANLEPVLGALAAAVNAAVPGTYSAPAVTTLAATALAATSAGVGGSVVASGLPTLVTVNYGLTTAYGSVTTGVEGGAATKPKNVTLSLTGLTPNTTYHYQAVATNALGTTNGADLTFTTPAA